MRIFNLHKSSTHQNILKRCNNKAFAFTLAEVLIVLGIIGVVAALTIPTLINNYQTQATITSLKKAYSEFSQAYTSAVQDNGLPSTWDLSDQKNILAILSSYMKINKSCLNGETGCFPEHYKQADGAEYFTAAGKTLNQAPQPKVILADGTLVVAGTYPTCTTYTFSSNAKFKNTCGEYTVDINGFKNPNQWGKDVFLFQLTDSGIMPVGSPMYDKNIYDFSTCSADRGYSCAAWVLYNENMDYLKCNDLAWNGKTKCN